MAQCDMSEANQRILTGVQKALKSAGMFAVQAVYNQMQSGYGAPIWDTGATMQSLAADEPTENSVSFGVSTDYAVYVHDGTYKMIERPFIRDVLNDPAFSQAASDLITEILNEELNT